MMPLVLADAGTEQLIHKVGGSPELKKHLEDLGFVPGGAVTLISAMRIERGISLANTRLP